jgi:hypothetical protein
VLFSDKGGLALKRPAAVLSRFGSGRRIAVILAAFLCAACLAYGIASIHRPAAQQTPFTPEQTYYQDIIYAVNEMHNQLAQMERQGSPPPDELDRQSAYVDSLMPDSGSPPEELTVALSLAEDLHRSYRQCVLALKNGDSARAQTSYRLASSQYGKFVQNANLITVLSAYNGVNVYCH